MHQPDDDREVATKDWQFEVRDLLAMVTIVAVSFGIGQNSRFAWAACAMLYMTAGFLAARNTERFRNSFTVPHIGSFFCLWFGFTFLTCFLLLKGSEQPHHVLFVMCMSVGCIIGPFVGAIARMGDPSCVEFGLVILPYSAMGLGLALLLQAAFSSTRYWMDVLRLFIWIAGLIVWFSSAIASLVFAGHSLYQGW